MSVHSILADALTCAAPAELAVAAITHLAHDPTEPVAAATAAAGDRNALALLSPTAQAPSLRQSRRQHRPGLALLAPKATWAGVTRRRRPGLRRRRTPPRHSPTPRRARHRRGNANRRLHAARQRALVIAGDHDYGHQLDGHLRLAGLPRAARAEDANPCRPRRPRRTTRDRTRGHDGAVDADRLRGRAGRRARRPRRPPRTALPTTLAGLANVRRARRDGQLAGVAERARHRATRRASARPAPATARQCSPHSHGWATFDTHGGPPKPPSGSGTETPRGTSDQTAHSDATTHR
jgi:hypothetical protein